MKVKNMTKPEGESYEWFNVETPLGKLGWIRGDLLSEKRVSGGQE